MDCSSNNLLQLKMTQQHQKLENEPTTTRDPPSQDELRTPPSSPGASKDQKAKVRRGFWGFGYKKSTSRSKGTLVEDTNDTEITEDVTERDDSLRSHDDSPGAGVWKKVVPNLVGKAALESKKKTTKKKAKGKSTREEVISRDDEQQIVAASSDVTAPKSNARTVVTESGENRNSPLRSNGHPVLKESSSRSNRSTGPALNTSAKENAIKKEEPSRPSNDIENLPNPPSDERGEIPSPKSPKRKRPRRVPRSGSVPKFLLGDGVSLSGKERDTDHQPLEEVSAGSSPKNEPANVQQVLQDDAAKPNDEADLPELVSLTSSMMPSTPSPTAKKKSILKVAETDEGAVESVVTTSVTQPGSYYSHYSLVVTRNSSDEVTCLTMEDFDKEEKPKRRAKRADRKKGAILKDMDRSSHTDPLEKAMSAAGGLSDAGLAEILRRDIHSKREPVLIAGLDAIKEFASKGSKQRTKVCSFGAIPSILRVMESKKTSTHIVFMSAVGALEKITAKVTRNQQTACELGAIPTIALAMQRNLAAPKALGAACKTLDMITSCLRLSIAEEDKYENIATDGVLTVLSCCLMGHANDKDIVTYGVGAITNICLYRRDKCRMLSEAGGVAAIRLALQKKWKSKSRKIQAKSDLEVITASLESYSSDEEEQDESSVEDDEEGEAEASHARTFDST